MKTYRNKNKQLAETREIFVATNSMLQNKSRNDVIRFRVNQLEQELIVRESNGDISKYLRKLLYADWAEKGLMQRCDEKKEYLSDEELTLWRKRKAI